jgi:hypothetical protein
MRVVRPIGLLGAIVCLAAIPGAGQGTAPQTQVTKASLTQAATQGYPLNTNLTVRANVTVQAVLLPPKVASRVFGKEIGLNYAVIELTITNKSPDASLIIQGAYIDYSNWALAGTVSPDLECQKGSGADGMTDYRACTQPSQIASEEYRVVRGELLDAQNGTWRNRTVRLLTLAASVASAYAFTTTDTDVIRGISAFGGTVVPAYSTFWPDNTVAQLNRISDFGFQTNKVIPKQGADIIVCFFPIDRFLTESFRKLFIENPAVFFSPVEALVDEKVQKQVLGRLPPGLLVKDKQDEKAAIRQLGQQVPCFLYKSEQEREQAAAPAKNQKPPENVQPSAGGTPAGNPPATEAQSFVDKAAAGECDKTTGGQSKMGDKNILLLDFVNRLSLNNVRIVIDGVMSVEASGMAAKIESVKFDDSTDWTDTKASKKGTITGSYLTGGTPKIQNQDALGITDVAAITQGSSDQTLPFSLKLSKPVGDQTELSFTVEKKAKDGTTATTSAPYQYQVLWPPQVNKIEFKGDTATRSALCSDGGTEKTGTITGTYLTGGVPTIQKQPDTISELKAVTAGSDDKALQFSLKLSKALDDKTPLGFIVERTAKDGHTVTSTLFTYTVACPAGGSGGSATGTNTTSASAAAPTPPAPAVGTEPAAAPAPTGDKNKKPKPPKPAPGPAGGTGNSAAH